MARRNNRPRTKQPKARVGRQKKRPTDMQKPVEPKPRKPHRHLNDNDIVDAVGELVLRDGEKRQLKENINGSIDIWNRCEELKAGNADKKFYKILPSLKKVREAAEDLHRALQEAHGVSRVASEFETAAVWIEELERSGELILAKVKRSFAGDYEPGMATDDLHDAFRRYIADGTHPEPIDPLQAIARIHLVAKLVEATERDLQFASGTARQQAKQPDLSRYAFVEEVAGHFLQAFNVAPKPTINHPWPGFLARVLTRCDQNLTEEGARKLWMRVVGYRTRFPNRLPRLKNSGLRPLSLAHSKANPDF